MARVVRLNTTIGANMPHTPAISNNFFFECDDAIFVDATSFTSFAVILKLIDSARIGIKCCVTSVCGNRSEDVYLAGGLLRPTRLRKKIV